MKSCTKEANKSVCSVGIFKGMLPKGEAFVGLKIYWDLSFSGIEALMG